MPDILGNRAFYVYIHKQGDAVVYVGSGRGCRAWQSNRCHRNPEHMEFMEVPTGCTEKYGSLKTASRIAMQLSPHFPHVIDFDVGRIRVHRTPYSEDAFTVLTKPTEIKNLCMVARS